MAVFLAVLNALRAIPQIASYVEKLIMVIAKWQDEAKAARIEDALIQAKLAKSNEERARAAKAIHDAIGS